MCVRVSACVCIYYIKSESIFPRLVVVVVVARDVLIIITRHQAGSCVSSSFYVYLSRVNRFDFMI